jgi:hypothetical protein
VPDCLHITAGGARQLEVATAASQLALSHVEGVAGAVAQHLEARRVTDKLLTDEVAERDALTSPVCVLQHTCKRQQQQRQQRR